MSSGKVAAGIVFLSLFAVVPALAEEEQTISISKKSKQGAEVLREGERTAEDAKRAGSAGTGSEKLDASADVAGGATNVAAEIEEILKRDDEEVSKTREAGQKTKGALQGAGQTTRGIEDKDAGDIGHGTGKVLESVGKKDAAGKARTAGDVAEAGQEGQRAMEEKDLEGAGRSAEDIAESLGKKEGAEQIRTTTDVYGLGTDLQGDMKEGDVEGALGTGADLAEKVGAGEAGQTLDKTGKVYGTGTDLQEAMEERDWAEAIELGGDLAEQLGIKFPGQDKLGKLDKWKKKKKGDKDGGSGQDQGNSPVFDGTQAEENKKKTDEQIEEQYGVVPSNTSTEAAGREAADIARDMTLNRTLQDRATMLTGDVREPRSYALMLTAGGAIQSQGLLQQKMQENYTLAMIIQELAMINYLKAQENLQWAKDRLWEISQAQTESLRREQRRHRETISGF